MFTGAPGRSSYEPEQPVDELSRLIGVGRIKGRGGWPSHALAHYATLVREGEEAGVPVASSNATRPQPAEG